MEEEEELENGKKEGVEGMKHGKEEEEEEEMEDGKEEEEEEKYGKEEEMTVEEEEEMEEVEDGKEEEEEWTKDEDATDSYNNANAIINNNAKNGNFYNGNGQQMIGQNEWQRKQRILRVKTDEKFTLKYQINTEEGQVIVDYINKARAVIARGEASNLPIASGMNQIKWKRSLASEAVKLLGTNQNRPVNILDLEVVHLIAGGYGQGADASDYGKQQNGDDEQQSSGYGYRNRDYEYFSSLDKNFIELKATDVLLMTVKNYLEMFMGQKGLNCDVNSCKATCKVPKRNREVPIKREDENPSEYFCYPYELIYDHTHSIGCAVHFETKRKTELRGKLVCIM
uniref:Uncharacterized protein n=1 Tax=Globodera pallida TaxID=36090 RepID=A0A183CF73_GLOPA